MFDEHFRYELGRLAEMYRLMAQPDLFNFESIPTEHRPTIEDALIVAFCSHARNLIEFFEKSPNDYKGCAKDFAKDKFMPLKIEQRTRLHKLRGMLNNQINHLTYDRTNNSDEKIKAPERKELFEGIHDEVVRWNAVLKPEYADFPINTDSLAEARGMVHSTSPSMAGTMTFAGSR
jgi:hypothetical protein